MARRNRVTPTGEILATPDRGTVMGNRGVLHDEGGRVHRPWQGKRWLLCRLEFRGRRRVVMAPGRYTELFFLDEATGLAAGHRPCFECRRRSFHDFLGAWVAGSPGLLGGDRPTAPRIDAQLHVERVGPDRSKRTFRAVIDTLPDGVFVTLDGGGDQPYLVYEGRLLAWSPGGYDDRLPRPVGEEVSVLTPRSTVEAVRAGYPPGIHPSARAG